MEKYSVVAKDECIACGSCSGIAPEIFDHDAEGYSGNIYKGDDNTGTVAIEADLHGKLTDAAEGCPTEAIKVSDTPFS